MKLGDIVKLWTTLEALDDELDGLPPGEEITAPKIRGVKIDGKRFTVTLTLKRE